VYAIPELPGTSPDDAFYHIASDGVFGVPAAVVDIISKFDNMIEAGKYVVSRPTAYGSLTTTAQM
jgi:hypothetical protein